MRHFSYLICRRAIYIAAAIVGYSISYAQTPTAPSPVTPTPHTAITSPTESTDTGFPWDLPKTKTYNAIDGRGWIPSVEDGTPACTDCAWGINRIIFYINLITNHWTVDRASTIPSASYAGTLQITHLLPTPQLTAGRIESMKNTRLLGPLNIQSSSLTISGQLNILSGGSLPPSSIDARSFVTGGLTQSSLIPHAVGRDNVRQDQIQIRRDTACHPGCAILGVTIRGNVICHPITQDDIADCEMGSNALSDPSF